MAHIRRQATVVRDGMHNAFTDLTYWQGAYWVAYRKGAGHKSYDACICIAVSYDRERFFEVARVRVPGDNREAKFAFFDQQQMAIVFPSWEGGYDSVNPNRKRFLRQYVTFTQNGYDWSTPQAIEPSNRWLWRVRYYEGTFYGLSYGPATDTDWEDKQPDLQLLCSEDLVNWNHIATLGASGKEGLGESDLIVRDNGEMWILSRSSCHSKAPAWFACAEPPYTDWQLTELPVPIHSPALIEHNGEVYVAGRRIVDAEGDDLHFHHNSKSMGIWRVERGNIELVLRIPATGDCAYPGLIHDGDGRLCMSYYSQHAYDMGIFPKDYTMRTNGEDTEICQVNRADVYFAEVALP